MHTDENANPSESIVSTMKGVIKCPRD